MATFGQHGDGKLSERSRTAWIWVYLPVAVKRTTAEEEVEYDDHVADSHNDIANVDPDLVVPTKSCL